MNQLCKVCGEPAAGFHFGAFTCEGCKSFFGRTYNNISAISGCKNNGDCVINKKNRTACKACRLRKCLLVGMSKSGSRYGRRSNWFKIHCLLQEQQSQQQQQQQQQHQHQQHHHQQHSTHAQIQSNFEQLTNLNQQFQIRSSTVYSQHKISPQQDAKTVNVQNPNSLVDSFFPVQHLINGGSRNLSKDITTDCGDGGEIERSANNSGDDHCQKKSNNRVNESASDSGASSADPEDSGSNKDRHLDSPVERDEKFQSHTPNSDPIRSASEPLRGFPLFQTHDKLTSFIAFPPLHIPTSILPSSISATVSIQEEPIDLSVKSRKRCRTTSPKPNGVDLPKTTPLDLTLVRSQPMSG